MLIPDCGNDNQGDFMKSILGACLGAALLFAAQARADDYPARTIRMIIPAAPGGAVDTIGRVIAEKLSQSLGKQVVPDNRAGAGTMLASQELATSAPDGYTILMVTSSHAINAAVRKAGRYDPVKDFAAVSLVASVPDLLVVNATSPIRSVSQLVDAAHKEPGKYTYGSAGPGSYSQMDAELFKSMTGSELLHVPYKGGVPAITALLGNEINMMFLSAPGLVGHVKAGKLRALAITSNERSSMLPEVPTLNEAGVKGFYAASWYGVLVPAKTPPAVIAVLNRRVNEALKLPDVKARLNAVGVDTTGSTPQYFGTYLADEITRWQKVVEKSPQLRTND
jgi:tripartite-type tricarboxylate transporter receptor subunit TctC